MSFDWSTYSGLAEELLAQAKNPNVANPGFKEARLRSAISRAYYAVFIKARNYLIAKDEFWPSEGENEHTYVRRQFQDNFNRVRSQISQDLYRLREDRNIADYDDNTPADLEKTTAGDLAIARRALANLNKLK